MWTDRHQWYAQSSFEQKAFGSAKGLANAPVASDSLSDSLTNGLTNRDRNSGSPFSHLQSPFAAASLPSSLSLRTDSKLHPETSHTRLERTWLTVPICIFNQAQERVGNIGKVRSEKCKTNIGAKQWDYVENWAGVLAILGLCFEDSLFFVLAALPPASNDTTTSWNMLHLEDFCLDRFTTLPCFKTSTVCWVCSADLSVRTCDRKVSGSLTSNATNNVEGEERKSIGKALVLETLLCALVMCIIRTFRLSFSFFASHFSWRTKLQTRGLLPSNQGLKWLKDDIYFGSFT